MSGSVVKSILKETIKNLPEDQALKSQSIAPMLLKKGVKPEELKWSAIDFPEGKVTKEQMVEAEANRADKFNVVEGRGDYKSYSLINGQNNPTYREKVLTYNDAKGQKITQEDIDLFDELYSSVEDSSALEVARRLGYEGEDIDKARDYLTSNKNKSRYTSSHFPDVPNYLAHTRVFDDTIDGKPSRVLMEIQSDLHQQARKDGGYAGDGMTTDQFNEAIGKIRVEAAKVAKEEGLEISDSIGMDDLKDLAGELDNSPLRDRLIELYDESTKLAEEYVSFKNMPKSPQEKTWLAKGIERELVDAVNDGKEQLMIPIKGYGIQELHRAAGPQRWYETQVLDTAKKVAKRAGADFEMYKKPVKLLNPDLVELGKMPEDELIKLINAARVFGENPSSVRGQDYEYNKIYEAIGPPGTFLRDMTSEGLSAEIKSRYDAGFMTYAVIKPSMNYTTRKDYVQKINYVDQSIQEISEELEEYAVRFNIDFDKTNAIDTIRGRASMEGNEDILSKISTYDELQADSEHMHNKLLDSSTEGIATSTNKIEFNLYSSPAAGGFGIYMAYKSGYTEDEITSEFEAQGKTAEEINRYKDSAVKIKEALDAGYTEDQIKDELDIMYTPAESKANTPKQFESDALGRWAKGNSLSAKNVSLSSLMSEDAKTAKDLLAKMQTIKPTLTSNVMTDVGAFFGNQEAMKRHNLATVKSRDQIIRLMKTKYDVDLDWDYKDGYNQSWKIINKDGTVEEVTPDFWQDIQEESGELIGAIGGMYAGISLAPPALPLVGPLSKPIGGAIGGAIGGIVGSELDYMVTAFQLQEDYEAEAMAYTALNAAEIAVVGEALGYAGVKLLGLGWKGIVKAKDLLYNGNTEGAYRALKDTGQFTDEELVVLVDKLEKVMTVPGKNQKEKSIAAVALSESGMQDLVRAAGGLDQIASKRVLDSIDKRAKSVLAATGDISTENSAKRFILDLSNYTGDVKGVYDKVKLRATHSPRAGNFEFDYDSIAIDPILEELSGKITDPDTLNRFLLQAGRIRTMTESRSFSDLIELRQITNDFLFNKRITTYDSKKMIRGVVDRIDDLITNNAKNVVDNPEQWLDDWATAKSEYSKMKKVEEKAMYKLVFDKKGNVKPVGAENVTKAMTKYITALDGNFDKIMEQLPPNARKVYEGAVINTLANKYTVGYAGEKQALHFPALAEELNKVKFLSPEARSTKDALLEFSELFKNDLPLALTNSSFKVPAFQSYLTTDPVVRAKFEIASGVFNYIKTLAPTAEQRANALIHKTAKLLEEPLNAKTANDLIEEFRQDPGMLKMISQVQRDTAYAQAKGLDAKSMKVQIFEGGKYKGAGKPIARIGRHRIASLEVIARIADEEAVSINSNMLDSILKQHGYAAVENGTDRVRLLK